MKGRDKLERTDAKKVIDEISSEEKKLNKVVKKCHKALFENITAFQHQMVSSTGIDLKELFEKSELTKKLREFLPSIKDQNILCRNIKVSPNGHESTFSSLKPTELQNLFGYYKIFVAFSITLDNKSAENILQYEKLLTSLIVALESIKSKDKDLENLIDYYKDLNQAAKRNLQSKEREISAAIKNIVNISSDSNKITITKGLEALIGSTLEKHGINKNLFEFHSKDGFNVALSKQLLDKGGEQVKAVNTLLIDNSKALRNELEALLDHKSQSSKHQKNKKVLIAFCVVFSVVAMALAIVAAALPMALIGGLAVAGVTTVAAVTTGVIAKKQSTKATEATTKAKKCVSVIHDTIVEITQSISKNKEALKI